MQKRDRLREALRRIDANQAELYRLRIGAEKRRVEIEKSRIEFERTHAEIMRILRGLLEVLPEAFRERSGIHPKPQEN